MPNKPKKPCAHRGCRELTANRYCDTHAKEAMKHYNKHQRDTKSNKRYGRRWREIRASYLSANPLCAECWKAEKLTAATTVHHKKRLADGGTHYWDNLMSLCAECHSRLHAEQGDYF